MICERSSFSADELREVLYWLDEWARTSVVVALRRSGWLEFEPGEGTTLTDAGRWAYDVLGFLHRRPRESELLPTVASVEYALEIGMDPIRHLLSMRSRVVSLRAEIDAARASHSEVCPRPAGIVGVSRRRWITTTTPLGGRLGRPPKTPAKRRDFPCRRAPRLNERRRRRPGGGAGSLVRTGLWRPGSLISREDTGKSPELGQT
jgi:hypothetical protein